MDNVPSAVAFGNTLQTLRKRSGIKSSSIEKNEAAEAVVAEAVEFKVVSPVDDEKKLTNDKLVHSSGQDDHNRIDVGDQDIMKSKCTLSNPIVTSKVKSTMHIEKFDSATLLMHEAVSNSYESYPGCEKDGKTLSPSLPKLANNQKQCFQAKQSQLDITAVKGENEMLLHSNSNKKQEQSAQMASSIASEDNEDAAASSYMVSIKATLIESQTNEAHPVFQQQTEQKSSFASLNEMALTSTSPLDTTTTSTSFGSMPKLLLPIQKEEVNIATENDEALQLHSKQEGCHKDNTDQPNPYPDESSDEAQSTYFSTYYNPTTPPSPDTIIEVDPQQFLEEVYHAMEDVDADDQGKLCTYIGIEEKT